MVFQKGSDGGGGEAGLKMVYRKPKDCGVEIKEYEMSRRLAVVLLCYSSFFLSVDVSLFLTFTFPRLPLLL